MAAEQRALVQRLDACVGESIGRVRAMSSLTDKLERRQFERVPAGSAALGTLAVWRRAETPR